MKSTTPLLMERYGVFNLKWSGYMSTKNWVVYLLRCSDNSIYCGISNNVARRVDAHNGGSGAKYTRSRRPVKLVTASCAMTRSEALKLEYRIRRLPADQKIGELKKWRADIEPGN